MNKFKNNNIKNTVLMNPTENVIETFIVRPRLQIGLQSMMPYKSSDALMSRLYRYQYASRDNAVPFVRDPTFSMCRTLSSATGACWKKWGKPFEKRRENRSLRRRCVLRAHCLVLPWIGRLRVDKKGMALSRAREGGREGIGKERR